MVSTLHNYNASVSGRLGCSIQEVIIETLNMYKRGKKSPDNETAKRPSKRTAVPIMQQQNFINKKQKNTVKDTILK